MHPANQAIVRTAIEMIRIAMLEQLNDVSTGEVADAADGITDDPQGRVAICCLIQLAARLALTEPTKDPEAVLDDLALKFLPSPR